MEIGSNTNIESDYLVLVLKTGMFMFECLSVFTDFRGPFGESKHHRELVTVVTLTGGTCWPSGMKDVVLYLLWAVDADRMLGSHRACLSVCF